MSSLYLCCFQVLGADAQLVSIGDFTFEYDFTESPDWSITREEIEKEIKKNFSSKGKEWDESWGCQILSLTKLA